MATHTRFFAMALSYKKTGEPRADVVIKAHSEQNAASLASHLAADGGGSVAFSCKGENAQPDDATILARFGVVPDDRTFLRRFAGLGKSAKPRGPNEGDEPIAQGRGSSGLLHFVRSFWQAALERAPARSEHRRLSWAIAGVVYSPLLREVFLSSSRRGPHSARRGSWRWPAPPVTTQG